MVVSKVSLFEAVFAVTDEPTVESSLLLGTAFAIGQGAFATAGHVAEALAVLRAFQASGEARVLPIRKSESWGNIDYGLIEADFEPPIILPWLENRIGEASDVSSVGFAFGQDLQRRRLTMRHFKGHLVSTQRYASWGELQPERAGLKDHCFLGI